MNDYPPRLICMKIKKSKKETGRNSKEDFSQDYYKPLDVPIIYIHNTKDAFKNKTKRYGE